MLLESKTRKIGNSIGVILPKEALARMNLREGDPVYLTESVDGGFRITPYHPDFERQMRVAESLMGRYRNALKKLAQ